MLTVREFWGLFAFSANDKRLDWANLRQIEV